MEFTNEELILIELEMNGIIRYWDQIDPESKDVKALDYKNTAKSILEKVRKM